MQGHISKGLPCLPGENGIENKDESRALSEDSPDSKQR